jgi:hypothetical protein
MLITKLKVPQGLHIRPVAYLFGWGDMGLDFFNVFIGKRVLSFQLQEDINMAMGKKATGVFFNPNVTKLPLLSQIFHDFPRSDLFFPEQVREIGIQIGIAAHPFLAISAAMIPCKDWSADSK